jgi:flagellar motor switch protein FliN/FliY
LASDISSIIQSELVNTFESLLSLEAKVNDVVKIGTSDLDDNQHLKIDISLSFSGNTSSLIIYLPTLIATKFEYFMLGGIGDIKASIDDEIIDACKEIIATIGGGLSTTINAQDYDDITSFSFNINDSSLIDVSDISDDTNLYKFNISFNDEEVSLLMKFDDVLLPFINSIASGGKIEDIDEPTTNEVLEQNASNLDPVLAMLGEHSSDNLKLLFDVKLKFSVRLGTKTFLLKDIVNWDVGEIIELDQMVNEPLDILVNNIKVGEGEAVIVENKFGIKIKYIGEINV